MKNPKPVILVKVFKHTFIHGILALAIQNASGNLKITFIPQEQPYP